MWKTSDIQLMTLWIRKQKEVAHLSKVPTIQEWLFQEINKIKQGQPERVVGIFSSL